MGAVALMYVRLNDVKKANEYTAVAQALNPRIRDDKSSYVQSDLCVNYAICLLQPFRSVTDPFLQSYKDFKVSWQLKHSSFSSLSLALHTLTVNNGYSPISANGRGRNVT